MKWFNKLFKKRIVVDEQVIKLSRDCNYIMLCKHFMWGGGGELERFVVLCKRNNLKVEVGLSYELNNGLNFQLFEIRN